MPTGKVKWYDAEKGFGFLSKDEGGDVYVRNDALPAGVATLKAGTRVEFGIVQGAELHAAQTRQTRRRVAAREAPIAGGPDRPRHRVGSSTAGGESL